MNSLSLNSNFPLFTWNYRLLNWNFLSLNSNSGTSYSSTQTREFPVIHLRLWNFLFLNSNSGTSYSSTSFFSTLNWKLMFTNSKLPIVQLNFLISRLELPIPKHRASCFSTWNYSSSIPASCSLSPCLKFPDPTPVFFWIHL